jgi:hypothetical protein
MTDAMSPTKPAIAPIAPQPSTGPLPAEATPRQAQPQSTPAAKA